MFNKTRLARRNCTKTAAEISIFERPKYIIWYITSPGIETNPDDLSEFTEDPLEEIANFFVHKYESVEKEKKSSDLSTSVAASEQRRTCTEKKNHLF